MKKLAFWGVLASVSIALNISSVRSGPVIHERPPNGGLLCIGVARLRLGTSFRAALRACASASSKTPLLSLCSTVFLPN